MLLIVKCGKSLVVTKERKHLWERETIHCHKRKKWIFGKGQGQSVHDDDHRSFVVMMAEISSRDIKQ